MINLTVNENSLVQIKSGGGLQARFILKSTVSFSRKRLERFSSQPTRHVDEQIY